jgi:DNA-binding response OmpR family regulator
MQTILIVEDEEDILELIEYILQKDGFDVIGLKDAKKVLDLLDEEEIDLILMDRNLPGKEGSLFVRQMRKEGYDTPVIYVSAKDSSDDIVEGFDRGGDDYITKPFNLKELVARVKAVIKRAKKESEILKFRDIVYDLSAHTVKISGNEVVLSKLEKRLLLEFLKNQNRLLSRSELLDSVWEDDMNKQEKTVNVAIKRLKEKIDPNRDKNYIKSIRGEGYMLC